MPSRFEKYTTHDTSRRTDGRDYTQPSAYFVTICAVSGARKYSKECTEDRGCLFGTVRQGRMYLNALGRIVATEWKKSEALRDRVHLDAFIVMPDHLHGIVVFAAPDVDAPTCPRNYRAFGGNGGSEGENSSRTDDPSDDDGLMGSAPENVNAEPTSADDATDSTNASAHRTDDSTDESNSTKASTGGSTLSLGGKSSTRRESDPEEIADADRPTGPAPKSLGSFVAGFKSAATTRINDRRDMPGAPVWQRNYHDRIIRTERHWRAAREYIRRNPAEWGG